MKAMSSFIFVIILKSYKVFHFRSNFYFSRNGRQKHCERQRSGPLILGEFIIRRELLLIAAKISQATESPGEYRYTAKTRDDVIVVEILDPVCLDNMTGMPYPDTVVVTINGKKLQGCGGAPEKLLQGVQWEVDTLDGAGLIADSRITVVFGEKRVSGHSSCNRYIADYKLTGESLSISEPASTRKACRVDIMAQEKRFLRMLKNVTRFGVVSDDRIKLITKAHDNITLQK